MSNQSKSLFTYENRLVLILAIVGGVASMDMLAFNFLSPFIATDLHLNNSQIGLIGGVGLLTWAIGAISSALWSDHIARRRIFLIGALLCFGLFSMATAMVTSFLTLIAVRLLIGLAEGPVVPMQNAIMHAESSPHRRGINLGIVQNFGSTLLGGLVGALVLVALATSLGWRKAFMIAAMPAFALAVIVRLAVREPKHERDTESHVPLLQTVRTIVAVHNIRLCFFIGTCCIGWLSIVTIFVPLWIVRQLQLTPAAMSIAMACFGGAGALAAIIVPGLSDKLGRRPVLVGFALVGLVIPLGMLSGTSSVLMLGMIMFVGSFFTGVMPLFIGIIPMESVDAKRGATALAIVMGCAQVAGSIVGPLPGGVLADHFSLAMPFWLAAGLAVGAALIGLLLTETAPAKCAATLTTSREKIAAIA